jgi:hypothetical protein
MLFSETWAKIGVFFECGGVWGIKNITGGTREKVFILKRYSHDKKCFSFLHTHGREKTHHEWSPPLFDLSEWDWM